MRKITIFITAILIAVFAFALIPAHVWSSGDANIPVVWWYKAENWIKTGTWTATNKTFTSPTITGGTVTGTTVFSGTPSFTSAPTFSGSPVFSSTPSFTGAPTFSGSPVFSSTPSFTGIPTFKDLKAGVALLDSTGRWLIPVRNKAGSALAEGDVLCWDQASVIVVADAAMAATATIANNLSAEGGFRTLILTATGTADAGDSVHVYGTTYEGGAGDYTSMLIPAVNNVVFAVIDTATTTQILHWSKIDSITFNADAVADGATSMIVNSYAVGGVILSDGANTDMAGISVGAIADNAVGYICVKGITPVVVDAGTTDCFPGTLLEGAANGDAVVDAAATAAKNIGRAIEASTLDDYKILVNVDMM